MSDYDTICAISTALGKSAINIIRVSGSDSIRLVSSILKGIDLSRKAGGTISLARIYDKDEMLDEVLVSLFKAPKSYTKEDIVEINTHGGIYVTERVLELLIEKGCRLAEPGEFTKRAFLNGRIDLSKAESVMDMIEAETKRSLSLANKGLKGDVYKEVSALRKNIEEILLHITVNIDYPEYTDELIVSTDLCINKTDELIKLMHNTIKSAQNQRVYKEGIKTAIIGKPNVGKSSLLNKLLKEDKAIVTNIQGTTRDIVEGELNMNGIILHLIDTAGIRKTDDPIEKIGIDKTMGALNEAELVILMLDHESGITKEDLELIKLTENKNRIIVANKSDLNNNMVFSLDYIDVSVLKDEGIDLLKEKIHDMFIKEEDKSTYTAISSSRHISLLKKAMESLLIANNAAKNGDFLDMVAIDLKSAYDSLGLIIGETSSDTLINELFMKFCLGK